MSLTIFKKEYDGESLYDILQDVGECINEDYNPVMCSIPVNMHGLQHGKFKVSIVWREE